MSETLEVGGLTFEVRRSLRRKTLGLTVDRGGELRIYAPENTTEHELAQVDTLEALVGASHTRAQGSAGAEGART